MMDRMQRYYEPVIFMNRSIPKFLVKDICNAVTAFYGSLTLSHKFISLETVKEKSKPTDKIHAYHKCVWPLNCHFIKDISN